MCPLHTKPLCCTVPQKLNQAKRNLFLFEPHQFWATFFKFFGFPFLNFPFWISVFSNWSSFVQNTQVLAEYSTFNALQNQCKIRSVLQKWDQILMSIYSESHIFLTPPMKSLLQKMPNKLQHLIYMWIKTIVKFTIYESMTQLILKGHN